jgi:hypothetical protein
MRVTKWFGGVIVFAATAILVMISQKFLFDSTAQAAARGITLSTPLGVTIARVGFGGFPLASAIITATSLFTGRIRRGLWFIVILFGTVLAVRVVSAATNGSFAENVPLIIPEVVFVGLSIIALAIGRSPEPAVQPITVRHSVRS